MLNKVVDLAQRIFRPMPFSVEAKYFDRYHDNTLKILCIMGYVIGYVVTPDGRQHSFKEAAADIGQARRIGYTKYDNAHRDWIGNAATSDLITLHEEQIKAPFKDNALLLALEVALNLRSGLQFKNVAYG